MPGHDPAPDDEDGLAAFAAVVRDHWDAVYRFVYGTTGDRHDAEDLTQETFLRGWNRFATFRAGTNLRSWFLRIAANAVCDVKRRRRRVGFRPLEHEPQDPLPDPEHRLEVAEQAALLQAALGGLSELTRMVFHLRVQESLSFREIADMVGSTEQSARWHMHHARTTLLKQFADRP